jgi:hypothetical protein
VIKLPIILLIGVDRSIPITSAAAVKGKLFGCMIWKCMPIVPWWIRHERANDNQPTRRL